MTARKAWRWLANPSRDRSLDEMKWHFFGRVVALVFIMLAVLVVSYIAQDNEARSTPESVCVASWDCERGQRKAPAPEAPQPVTTHTPENR